MPHIFTLLLQVEMPNHPLTKCLAFEVINEFLFMLECPLFFQCWLLVDNCVRVLLMSLTTVLLLSHSISHETFMHASTRRSSMNRLILAGRLIFCLSLLFLLLLIVL